MKCSKWMLVFAAALVAALALTGCMNTGNQNVEPQASVWPSASVSPGMNDTGDVGNTGNLGNTGAATPFNWTNNAPQVETAINQISEISDSRVVVTGTTALAAVKYTTAYRGETTERIREMVAGAVREADPTIQTVAVTSEEKDVNDVFAMADQIRSGTAPDTLTEEINRIVRNPTTLR